MPRFHLRFYLPGLWTLQLLTCGDWLSLEWLSAIELKQTKRHARCLRTRHVASLTCNGTPCFRSVQVVFGLGVADPHLQWPTCAWETKLGERQQVAYNDHVAWLAQAACCDLLHVLPGRYSTRLHLSLGHCLTEPAPILSGPHTFKSGAGWGLVAGCVSKQFVLWLRAREVS